MELEEVRLRLPVRAEEGRMGGETKKRRNAALRLRFKGKEGEGKVRKGSDRTSSMQREKGRMEGGMNKQDSESLSHFT